MELNMHRSLTLHNVTARIKARFGWLEPYYSLEFDQRTKCYHVVQPSNGRNWGPYTDAQLLGLLRHIGPLRRSEMRDTRSIATKDGREISEAVLPDRLRVPFITRTERVIRDKLNPPLPSQSQDYLKVLNDAKLEAPQAAGETLEDLPEPDFDLPDFGSPPTEPLEYHSV